MNHLNELNAKDILKGSSKTIINRAKGKDQAYGIYVFFLGYVEEEKTLYYETTSGQTSGKKYKSSIVLKDADQIPELLKDGYTHREIVNLLVFGDIDIWCECPSWLYHGYQYIGTKLDYAEPEEHRFPEIRNPGLEGSLCKHLQRVLEVLPMMIFKITKAMEDAGAFKVEKDIEVKDEEDEE